MPYVRPVVRIIEPSRRAPTREIHSQEVAATFHWGQFRPMVRRLPLPATNLPCPNWRDDGGGPAKHRDVLRALETQEGRPDDVRRWPTPLWLCWADVLVSRVPTMRS